MVNQLSQRCAIPVVQIDSDGDTVAFDVLISQLFEFLLTLIGNARFLPLLQHVLPDLMYITIGVRMRGMTFAPLHPCSPPGAPPACKAGMLMHQVPAIVCL